MKLILGIFILLVGGLGFLYWAINNHEYNYDFEPRHVSESEQQERFSSKIDEVSNSDISKKELQNEAAHTIPSAELKTIKSTDEPKEKFLPGSIVTVYLNSDVENSVSNNILQIRRVNPKESPVILENQNRSGSCSIPLHRKLEKGMQGDDVLLVQQILIQQGFLPENDYTPGLFGETTKSALYNQGIHYFAYAFQLKYEYGKVSGIIKDLFNDLYCFGNLTQETNSKTVSAAALQLRTQFAIEDYLHTLDFHSEEYSYKDLCSGAEVGFKRVESDFNVDIMCQSTDDTFYVLFPNVTGITKYYCYDYRTPFVNYVDTVPATGEYECPQLNYYQYEFFSDEVQELFTDYKW